MKNIILKKKSSCVHYYSVLYVQDCLSMWEFLSDSILNIKHNGEWNLTTLCWCSRFVVLLYIWFYSVCYTISISSLWYWMFVFKALKFILVIDTFKVFFKTEYIAICSTSFLLQINVSFCLHFLHFSSFQDLKSLFYKWVWKITISWFPCQIKTNSLCVN